jgi:acylphosphatase
MTCYASRRDSTADEFAFLNIAYNTHMDRAGTQSNSLARLHAMVTGRVQGVYFRSFVQEQAAELGLKGWVRNRWDGSVEVTAEGFRSKLELLLQALHKGPPSAWVEDVDFEWMNATGEFIGFNVRSTA